MYKKINIFNSFIYNNTYYLIKNNKNKLNII